MNCLWDSRYRAVQSKFIVSQTKLLDKYMWAVVYIIIVTAGPLERPLEYKGITRSTSMHAQIQSHCMKTV